METGPAFEKGQKPRTSVDIEIEKMALNKQRSKELKKGFIIDNILLNKEIIKDMAVKYTTLDVDEMANWIDYDNNAIELSKSELATLVKKGANKVEEIYFRYRQLKNELETVITT